MMSDMKQYTTVYNVRDMGFIGCVWHKPWFNCISKVNGEELHFNMEFEEKFNHVK